MWHLASPLPRERRMRAQAAAGRPGPPRKEEMNVAGRVLFRQGLLFLFRCFYHFPLPAHRYRCGEKGDRSGLAGLGSECGRRAQLRARQELLWVCFCAYKQASNSDFPDRAVWSISLSPAMLCISNLHLMNLLFAPDFMARPGGTCGVGREVKGALCTMASKVPCLRGGGAARRGAAPSHV